MIITISLLVACRSALERCLREQTVGEERRGREVNRSS
jgi:hypothetical protein